MHKLKGIVCVLPFLFFVILHISLFSVFQKEILIEVLNKEDWFIFKMRVEGYILK